MHNTNPKISLLMVTFNRSTLLRQILRAISDFSWELSSFVIIDNGSNSETTIILNEFETSLNLSIIHLENNIGHGAGLAKGLDFLKANFQGLDYVVFLEDDSIPQENYLSFLLSKIQSSTYAMISSAGSKVSLGSRKKIQPSGTAIVEADFALFDGAIVRFQDLMKVGFPVRDWFMMFDDFEYCYRIRKAGLKIGVVQNPFLEILHEGWGGGTSHSHLWRAYYQSRNFIHFVRMHFTVFNFFDAIILQMKRLIGGLLGPNGFQTTRLRIMGIRAGLIGKKGKSLDLKSLKEI